MTQNNWQVPPQNYTNYLNICKRASEDSLEFKYFKQHPWYTPILEHLPKADAQIYYDEIKDQVSAEMFASFQENDTLGNPVLMEVEHGAISPTTVRYMKNSYDIHNNFTNIESIVEIGGGYGGLCKTLKCFGWNHYSIVDLYEPICLTQRYLAEFDIHPALYTPTPVISADLCISNYALSECTLQQQLAYFDNILVNCKNVYLTYNTYREGHFPTFMDRCEEFFNVKTYMEKINNGGLLILMSRK